MVNHECTIDGVVVEKCHLIVSSSRMTCLDSHPMSSWGAILMKITEVHVSISIITEHVTYVTSTCIVTSANNFNPYPAVHDNPYLYKQCKEEAI